MEKLLPRVLGGWAFLNALLVAGAAVLAFRRDQLIFEPQGVGPDRIAIAALFAPHESYTWAFLLGIALIMAIVGFGLSARKRWTRILLIVALIVAIIATIPAMFRGAASGSMGVVGFGALKISLYALLALGLNANLAKRALNQ